MRHRPADGVTWKSAGYLFVVLGAATSCEEVAAVVVC